MKKKKQTIIDEVMISEVYRDMETPDGPWYKIGENLSDRELTATDRKSLLENSRNRYYKTPEGRGLINNAKNFIIGQGIVYKSEDENPAVQETLEEFWDHKENNMESRQKEIVVRALRDGEVFIRFFSDATGMPILRFILPEQITKINKDPNDAEKVLSYHREWVPDGESTVQTEDIIASDVFHLKLNADADMDRGRPYIEPAIKRFVQLEQFIEGRIVRNRVASGLILEKIIKGKGATAAAVTSVKGMTSDATKDVGVSDAAKKMPKFGSMVTHNESIEYKWIEPHIDADNSKEDGRLIKQSILSAFNAPEYIFSDASNANYASTMVAESPYVRHCEDLQDTFKIYFKAILAEVIKRMIRAGLIGSRSRKTVVQERFIGRILPRASQDKGFYKRLRELVAQYESQEEIDTVTSVSIEFPPMIHKEIESETRALQVHSAMGWASDRTIAAKLGYNPEKEKEIIAGERKDKEADADSQYEDERKKLLDDDEDEKK